MRTLSFLTSVFLSLACCVSCGSSDEGKPGGGGGDAECEPIDVCDSIPIEHVNMVCGLATTTYSSTERPSPDPSQLPTVSGCDYDGSPAAEIEYECHSSADLASFYFTNEKNDPPSMEVQTDVTGVGDEAFLREDSVLGSSKLYVLDANLLIVVTAGWSGGGQAPAQTCLETLAEEALAL